MEKQFSPEPTNGNNLEENKENAIDVNQFSPEEIVNFVWKGNKIKPLDDKIVDKFIEIDNQGDGTDFYTNFILQNVDVFEEKYHSEIANKLIDSGRGPSLCENLKKFIGVNYIEIADKLISKGEAYYIIKNIEQFENLNESDIFNKALDNNPWSNRSANDEIPKEILNKLSVLENLNLDNANKLIEHGNLLDLINNLGSFKGLDSRIANQILSVGSDGEIAMAINIPSFKKLNPSIINQLINDGNAEEVAYYIRTDEFFDLDLSVANNLIDHGQPYSVLNNIDLFPELNIQNVINKVIKCGGSRIIAERIKEFKNIDYKETVDKIIETGFSKDLLSIDDDPDNQEISNHITYLDKFKGLDSETIEYIKNYSQKIDHEIVYKLRNAYSFTLKEIMARYDYFRVIAWEEVHGVLEDSDEKALIDLEKIIDKETIGKLWSNDRQESLHIIVPQILKMFYITGYNPDTFRGQFLEKIINDNSSYGGFTLTEDTLNDETIRMEAAVSALSHFKNIIEGLNVDFISVLNDASSFEQTKALAEKLKKDGPFKDWETLKKYYELAELLKKREVFEKLENLKKQGKEKQYNFFTGLAFHPGSKIPMQTVFQFMEDPGGFLDVGDVHSEETHERKKPSNYTKFEYLDISPEDLRDALIEGTLDKLQYFKPFDASYKIADNNYSNNELIKLLQNALGSFKEKINGNAKNPGKLFKITQEILKKYNLEYNSIVKNPLLMNNEVRNDLEKVLFDNNFGIKDNRKFEEYLVKIHPKSSPEGHLAGNDTACCMPFGSGKNNVYMYNLGCSILTVQRKIRDKYRTIAQSVLTPDVDIKYNIADLINKVEDQTLLSNIITEDLTEKKKIIITADNIEVSPNAEKYKNSIESIYGDFVSRYAHEINSTEIEKDRMLIGKGYSDLHFSRSKSIVNTFIPTTPVAYSDNYGKEVNELPLIDKSEIIPLPNYGMMLPQEKELIDQDLPKGVSYLSAHDTLRVSYMEGKVYAENESLVQYIHRIGNELTAKDINNSFKDRPNLSLKIEDENNTMLGYMIAYEGAKNNNYESGNQNTDIGLNEKIIYISDLAVDTSKSKLSGGKLIKAFEILIKREYLDKNNPLPIIAQARETTSYKIIQKHLNDLGKEYGYEYKLEENGSYESGQDTMYQIKLIPQKIDVIDE